MAWEGSDRRERLPEDWYARRGRVLKRDDHRCTWRLPSGKRCPRTTELEVDHVREGDDHSESNLRTLCAAHHTRKTSMDGRRRTAKIKASRFRPSEDHPGRVS